MHHVGRTVHVAPCRAGSWAVGRRDHGQADDRRKERADDDGVDGAVAEDVDFTEHSCGSRIVDRDFLEEEEEAVPKGVAAACRIRASGR